MSILDNTNGVFQVEVVVYQKIGDVYSCACSTVGATSEIEPDCFYKSVNVDDFHKSIENEHDIKGWAFDEIIDPNECHRLLADYINEQENRKRIYSNQVIK